MKSIKDDTEMFALFALYHKAEKQLDQLTKEDKRILRKWGVEIA